MFARLEVVYTNCNTLPHGGEREGGGGGFRETRKTKGREGGREGESEEGRAGVGNIKRE